MGVIRIVVEAKCRSDIHYWQLESNGDRVAIGPSALHSAIGREIYRGGSSSLKDAFERDDGVPPSLVLTPPSPPPNGSQWLIADTAFRLGLTLLDGAAEHLPQLLQSVELAGSNGVGGQWRGYRGFFEVQRVFQRPFHALNGDASRTCSVHFLTPLVRKDGDPVSPTFSEFWKAVRMRLFHLEKAYGLMGRYGLSSPYGLREIEDRVETVSVASQVVRWRRHLDAERERKLPLIEGFQGCVSFNGDLTLFLPYLRLASLCGVGSFTSLGCGRTKLTPGH